VAACCQCGDDGIVIGVRTAPGRLPMMRSWSEGVCRAKLQGLSYLAATAMTCVWHVRWCHGSLEVRLGILRRVLPSEERQRDAALSRKDSIAKAGAGDLPEALSLSKSCAMLKVNEGGCGSGVELRTRAGAAKLFLSHRKCKAGSGLESAEHWGQRRVHWPGSA